MPLEDWKESVRYGLSVKARGCITELELPYTREKEVQEVRHADPQYSRDRLLYEKTEIKKYRRLPPLYLDGFENVPDNLLQINDFRTDFYDITEPENPNIARIFYKEISDYGFCSFHTWITNNASTLMALGSPTGKVVFMRTLTTRTKDGIACITWYKRIPKEIQEILENPDILKIGLDIFRQADIFARDSCGLNSCVDIRLLFRYTIFDDRAVTYEEMISEYIHSVYYGPHPANFDFADFGTTDGGETRDNEIHVVSLARSAILGLYQICLLYTSDAADE